MVYRLSNLTRNMYKVQQKVQQRVYLRPIHVATAETMAMAGEKVFGPLSDGKPTPLQREPFSGPHCQ